MPGIFSSSYPIARSTGRCAATGREFAPREPLVAALAEAEGREDLQRLDFSLDAWASGSRPTPPLTLFASWRATHQPPDAKRKLLLGDEELLDLFEQLGATDQPRQRAFRFVLALLLVRRRILVYEGQQSGVMRVRERRNAAEIPAPIVEVQDPGLDDATTAAVIEQLSEVVGAD
jgi:hypothetical protein